VLHVDDEPDFAELTADFLEREDDRIDIVTETDAAVALDRLRADAAGIDCIVSDYEMPGLDGLSFLSAVREEWPDLPFILFTGKGSEEIASEAITGGVTDYLQKGPGSDQYALLSNRIVNAAMDYRRKRRLSEYRTAVEAVDDAVYALDGDGRIRMVNQSAVELFGRPREELLDSHADDLGNGGEGGAAVRELVCVATDRPDSFTVETAAPDGDRRIYECAVSPAGPDEGVPGGSVGIVREVTDRHRRERRVEALHDATRDLMSVSSREAVADCVVGTMRDILDIPVNAVYLSETAGALEPVAVSESGLELVGEPPVYTSEERSLAWETFQSGEPTLVRDMSARPERYNPDTPIGSEMIIPIGEYGVILAGSTETEAFDEVDVSLAGTLAANTEDALARLDRERELRRQRDLLRHTETLADTGGWELDVETEELRWTDGTRRIHDVGSDYEPTLSEAVAFYRQEDRETIRDRVERAIDTGEPFDVALRIRTAKGRERFVRSVGETVREDGETRLRGAIQDITDRKRTEAELREKSNLLDEIFDQIPAHLYVKDEEGRHVRVSDHRLGDHDPDQLLVDAFAREEILGRTDSEIAGTGHERSTHADDMQVVETGEPIINREEYSPADDEWYLTSKVPWRDDEGAVKGLIGITRRITEQKRNEQRLQRQNDRLDEFASVVSHDLRNPLQIAETRLELARGECDSDHLEAVADAHDRMDALIENLLTLARQGEDVTEFEAVDLASLVEECWGTDDGANARLVVETDATIRADANRLQQLVGNLLRNAREHGGPNVTVTVGRLDDGFYVADDGPGIPEAEREQVFESGFSTSDGGTGFGLAIAREIAEAHDWTVGLTESGGGGARFEITGVEFVA